MTSQLKRGLLALLAKIRQETGDKYRAEIEVLYAQLKALEVPDALTP